MERSSTGNTATANDLQKNGNVVTMEQHQTSHREHNSQASALELEKQHLHDKLRLQLTCALQTSLDAEKILNTYFAIIGSFVELTGVEYQTVSPRKVLAIGSKSKHTLNYQLDTGHTEVGEITYFCKTRVHGLSLETLEIATSTIVYPMHNAAQFAEAKTLAHEDPLTGLGNRRSLESHLSGIKSRALRYGVEACVMMIDIDHFKKINDQFGHDIGDKVLCRVAESLSTLSRDTDKVFRFGGEEFVCVLDDTDLTGAGLAAERFVAHIASLNLREIHPDLCNGEWANDNCSPTISIGFTEVNPKEPAENLFIRADSAMYQAKQQGRNQSVGIASTTH